MLPNLVPTTGDAVLLQAGETLRGILQALADELRHEGLAHVE